MSGLIITLFIVIFANIFYLLEFKRAYVNTLRFKCETRLDVLDSVLAWMLNLLGLFSLLYLIFLVVCK